MVSALRRWSRRPTRARARAAGALLPLPQRVKSLIERLWWRNLSNPATVESLLSLVYARPVDDERLLSRILQATEHPGKQSPALGWTHTSARRPL